MPFVAMRCLRVPAQEGLCMWAGLQLAKQVVCHAGQRHPGKRSVHSRREAVRRDMGRRERIEGQSYKSCKFLQCHVGLQWMSLCLRHSDIAGMTSPIGLGRHTPHLCRRRPNDQGSLVMAPRPDAGTLALNGPRSGTSDLDRSLAEGDRSTV